MSDNRRKTCSAGGHGFGAALTEPDSVPLAFAFENNLCAFSPWGEIVAGNRVPAKPAAQSQTAILAVGQQSKVAGRELARPAKRFFAAIVAANREIRINIRRQTVLRGRARASAATSCEHRGKWPILVSENKPTRLHGGTRRGTTRIWQAAQHLAMSQIAKIEAPMAVFRRHKIRARHHGLRFERF
jgi:hypothetical protein